MNVYVGTNSLKNAYIGEYVPYTPNANTLGYRPLKSDLKEASGKSGLDWSITRGSVTYSNNMASINQVRINSSIISGTMNFTVLFYRQNFNDNNFCFGITNTTTGTYAWYPIFSCSRRGLAISDGNNNWYSAIVSAADINNSLLLGAFVRNGSNMYYYENGVLKASVTGSVSLSTVGMYIGGYGSTDNSGTIGGVIVENRAWTQSEIQEYYNNSKFLYGL